MKLWKSADGTRATDEELTKLLIEYRSNNLLDDVQIIVGTDSNIQKSVYRFITIVCAYRPGRGGIFYRKSTHEPKEIHKTPRDRLFYEATLSIETANILRDAGMNVIVHVDASNPLFSKALSASFGEQIRGYVTNSGYPCELKPQSWAATSIANKYSKK
jgi:predicted RNase H-related nuclease YkuK (DUF458 family)